MGYCPLAKNGLMVWTTHKGACWVCRRAGQAVTRKKWKPGRVETAQVMIREELGQQLGNRLPQAKAIKPASSEPTLPTLLVLLEAAATTTRRTTERAINHPRRNNPMKMKNL